MPEKIQTLPRGLLSALGIVGSGVNPGILADDARVSLDGELYFLSQNLEVVSATTNGSTSGTESVLTVPQGEVWRVHAASVTVQIPAGDQTALNLKWQFSSAVPVGLAYAEASNGLATNLMLQAETKRPLSWLAPAGSVIVGTLRGGISAGRDVFTSALITRLTY